MKPDFKKKKIQIKYRKQIREKERVNHTKEIVIASSLLIIILLLLIFFKDQFQIVPNHIIHLEKVE